MNNIVFDPALHPRELTGRFRKKRYEVIRDRLLDGARSTREHWTRWSPTLQRTIYRDSRRPLHDQIVAKTMAGVTPAKDRIPKVTLLMGGSGVGKTWTLEYFLPTLGDNAVRVDPDAIKEQLPEYWRLVKEGDPLAAKVTHDESSDIAKRIQWESVQQGLDLLVDGTGAGPGFMDRVRKYKDLGYDVDILWVTCSIQKALDRVEERRRKTGRSLPEALVRLIHRDCSARLPEVIGDVDLIDNVTIYENEDAPHVVYQRQGSNELVVDGGALNRIWTKAERD